MKLLHRPDLFCWSGFDRARNVDFNGYAWVRPGGNVLVDPMPMDTHDLHHLVGLGGAAWIVLTNSDHVRAAVELAAILGARVAGPAAEADTFPLRCDRWLADGDEVVPGLDVLALDGSKTPGELALLLEGTTLITGDLVRAHRAGGLMALPEGKLSDPAAAARSVARLAALSQVEVVLVGDGWPLLSGGRQALARLALGMGAPPPAAAG
ncbi:MBL fold metallo-hydrolase [Myxococcota bacterium]|nr:MBL fold metallo-hydrolase [Myxococcota bacterium]